MKETIKTDPVDGTGTAKTIAGTVYLVGAGPGDEGLITVKGKKAIEEADCIIYDHLANSELLNYARPDCQIIYAGKENNHHTMKQEEINDLLARKARQYKKVVRLKGGDVYVFGRGGEEGIYLKSQGIPFVVVPGISSAIAGLAYGGIPITHRGISRGFRVITAHNQKGKSSAIDYASMVGEDETYVFLMGFSRVQEVVTGLLAAGKDPSCPVAVISNASLPDQKTCVGTLKTILSQMEQASLTPPALIVVGNVVGLRDSLNFFEEEPLYGARFLVTKVGNEPSKLTECLRENGAFVSEIQTGRIRRIPDAVTVPDLSKAKWIVLTSRNGAESFLASLQSQRIDMRLLFGKKFAVIGKKTANVLEQSGIYPDLIPEVSDSSALRAALEEHVRPDETILYGVPSGEENPELLVLKERYTVLEVCLYENQENPDIERDLEKAGFGADRPAAPFSAVFFTCASSVTRLWNHLSEKEKQGFRSGEIRAVSIGARTTAALQKAGVKEILQSGNAAYESMAEIALSLLENRP